MPRSVLPSGGRGSNQYVSKGSAVSPTRRGGGRDLAAAVTEQSDTLTATEVQALLDTVTVPAGDVTVSRVDDRGVEYQVSHAGSSDTVCVLTGPVTEEALSRFVLRSHTLAALRRADHEFTFDGLPLTALDQVDDEVWDENQPTELIHRSVFAARYPAWYEVPDYRPFEDGAVMVFADWNVNDSVPPHEPTQVNVSMMVFGDTRRHLAKHLYNFMGFAVAHDTAEQVTVNGRMPVDPHGPDGEEAGLGFYCPATIDWLTSCREVSKDPDLVNHVVGS